MTRVLLVTLCLIGTMIGSMIGSTAIASSAAQMDARDAPLDLTEAVSLAVTQQPLLQAQAAMVQAAQENAVAVAQLPDPKLIGGITDWPIDGANRYSLRRDDFTMLNLGVMQEWPRARKRQLRGERGEHEAALAAQMLTATRLGIERDVATAWLDVWQPERALELSRAALREAQLQIQATQIAYTASRATQAQVLAARVALSLLRDDVAALEQEAALARSKLSRWVGGDVAQRTLSTELPQWSAPAPLPDMLAKLRQHPHLNSEAKRVAIAEDDVALARQSFKSDWSVELGYNYRPNFPDYISLTVSLDLPVFTGNRQSRSLNATLSAQSAAEQMREDVYRQHEAELRLSWQGWQLLQARLQQFDDVILPQSEQRIGAAMASWRAGQGTLSGVLEARRMALDNRMKRLALRTEAAKYRVNLLYFAGDHE